MVPSDVGRARVKRPHSWPGALQLHSSRSSPAQRKKERKKERKESGGGGKRLKRSFKGWRKSWGGRAAVQKTLETRACSPLTPGLITAPENTSKLKGIVHSKMYILSLFNDVVKVPIHFFLLWNTTNRMSMCFLIWPYSECQWCCFGPHWLSLYGPKKMVGTSKYLLLSTEERRYRTCELANDEKSMTNCFR